jgi:hypothetical protein
MVMMQRTSDVPVRRMMVKKVILNRRLAEYIFAGRKSSALRMNLGRQRAHDSILRAKECCPAIMIADTQIVLVVFPPG